MGKVVSFLWILTPISSTISVIIVWVAMATSDWIRTQEKILNSQYNGSADNKYILKMTHSGIWEICTVTDGNTDISCNVIQYFSSELDYTDLSNSAGLIPYAVKQSIFFFVVAGLVQLFGELGYLYGHYVRYRKVFVFIGGSIFIVSGLIMLIGIVMYISIFRTEIGSKFKPTISSQPTFNYQYGVSFVLYVSGFICVELSGTCAVLLFVHQDQSIQSVHFIQPSPVIYRNYNLTSNPGMIYPCQKHTDLCAATDAISHHSVHVYPTHQEEVVQINHSYYMDPDNSPPYTPANRMTQYEEYNLTEADRTVPMQSATTQTISTIFDPYSLNDVETESNATDYLQREEFVSFDLNNMPHTSSMEKMGTLRKSTLV